MREPFRYLPVMAVSYGFIIYAGIKNMKEVVVIGCIVGFIYTILFMEGII